MDEAKIYRQALDYMENAEKYIWNVRQYKIDEFKKKMKKPISELKKFGQMKEREEKDKKNQEELEKKMKEA